MAILKILISQTKVSHFANKVVIKKNITSSQVSMDYLQKENILHCEYDNTFQKVSFERKQTPSRSFFKPGTYYFDDCK